MFPHRAIDRVAPNPTLGMGSGMTRDDRVTRTGPPSGSARRSVEAAPNACAVAVDDRRGRLGNRGKAGQRQGRATGGRGSMLAADEECAGRGTVVVDRLTAGVVGAEAPGQSAALPVRTSVSVAHADAAA